MLSYALPVPLRQWMVVLGTAIVVLVAPACGDDEDSSGDGGANEAGRGGRGGRGGSSGGAAAASPIEPLPEETAGKSCSENGDCGPGMCLDMLPGAFGVGSVAAPGGYCSGECLTDGDCGEGGMCSGEFTGIPDVAPIRGQCLQTCSENGDCRSGYRCVNGFGLPSGAAPVDGGTMNPATDLLGSNFCHPMPETDKLGNGVVGSSCMADGDCGDGRCLRMSNNTTYPGGYCTGRCLENADCGAGGTCTPGLAGGVGTCYLSCASDADCDRDGYRCRAQGMGGSMRCVPGAAPLPDNTVGEACAGDEECGGAAMSCAMRLGRYTAPGNYCTQRCVNASDCGAGGVCVGGGAGGGTCYRVCTDDSECREGYSCGPAGRTGSAAMTNICSVTPPPDDAGVE